MDKHCAHLQVLVNHENKIEYLKKTYELTLEPRMSVIFFYSNRIGNINFNVLENDQFSYENYWHTTNIEEFFIDNKRFLTTNKNFICITGPQSLIKRRISTLFKDEYCEVEIIHKTQPEIIIKRDYTSDSFILLTKNCRYAIRQSEHRQKIIKDICIAFASFDLPPYVLLEIIDWLPNMDYEKHFKKISLIISMRNSIRKIQEKRIKLDEI